MRDVGRDRAGAWLDANCERLGRESTVDIRTRFTERRGYLPARSSARSFRFWIRASSSAGVSATA